MVQENTEQTVKVLLTGIVLDALYVHQVPTALAALEQALEPAHHALLVRQENTMWDAQAPIQEAVNDALIVQNQIITNLDAN